MFWNYFSHVPLIHYSSWYLLNKTIQNFLAIMCRAGLYPKIDHRNFQLQFQFLPLPDHNPSCLVCFLSIYLSNIWARDYFLFLVRWKLWSYYYRYITLPPTSKCKSSNLSNVPLRVLLPIVIRHIKSVLHYRIWRVIILMYFEHKRPHCQQYRERLAFVPCSEI